MINQARINRLSTYLDAGQHPAYDPETQTDKYYAGELYNERGQFEVQEWAGLGYCVALDPAFCEYDDAQDFILEADGGEVYLTNTKGYSLLMGGLAIRHYFRLTDEQYAAIFLAPDWNAARIAAHALTEGVAA